MSDLLKAFMGPQDGDVRWEGGVITRVFNGGAWHNVPAPLCFQLASALNEVQWLKDKLVEAESDKLRAALQWQPIETALRISRHEILVWDGEHRFVAWWKSGAFWRADGAMFDPTHWMHLPPPPALKENNNDKG